jgi:hypothetical protein
MQGPARSGLRIVHSAPACASRRSTQRWSERLARARAPPHTYRPLRAVLRKPPFNCCSRRLTPSPVRFSGQSPASSVAERHRCAARQELDIPNKV